MGGICKCFIICLRIHVNEILFFLVVESGHGVRARLNCAEEMAQYNNNHSKVRQYIYMLFLNLRDGELTSRHENHVFANKIFY